MKYLAAYALCSLKGSAPTESELVKVLEAAGSPVDLDRIKHVVGELQGKDLNDLISQGSAKLQTFAVGGGSAAPAGSSSNTNSGAAAQSAAEAAPEEEEDEDMGLGLFD
ncbi:60S acidic ribosomal protein P2 [Perkinsela sp. CCAP 1560/4]|nr:60S acidic ribosomal protein P2 [Perkinsela sp. CCAP 1560/4]KNH09092.1 60S acidic ribosomal protein P2 [Perkinsela sp. CCAP 1560/4]|eukprot:KNH05323.1 60S acidic ribosomal protein P2 [Perkinsela sp. CCAP 1560/4]